MSKLSRYILVLITIISTMVAIPGLYWLAFEKPISGPSIFYSCVTKDFVVRRYDSGKSKYSNLKGDVVYTRTQYEQKLPLMYVRQLIISGIMPDTLNGVPLDIHIINQNRSFFRLKPKDIDAPAPGLYPMFESQSGRANLEMPQDFFRIKSRMEFINAENNSIEENKSVVFTQALEKKGFTFPSKMIEGIPSTRKSCDEGYFVVDAKDNLFHIKMIKGDPYVKKVNVPEGLKFKKIACVDFSDKKFYNYLISENNDIYILTQDDYMLIKLPLDGYDPQKEELRIFGNLFNYNAIFLGKDHLRIQVLNKQYQRVDQYSEKWPDRSQRIEGEVASYLFPAEISLSEWNSLYNKFYFKKTAGYRWLILNLLLIIVYVIILRKREIDLKKGIIDYIIIGVTGIFGFIAVNFFPNKFFD